MSSKENERKRTRSSETKGSMTVEEAGRKGGQRTAETHGREFYSEIGKKGGEIGGPKGGAERAKQHEGTAAAQGETSLEEAGHMGGQKVKKLIEEGKARENR